MRMSELMVMSIDPSFPVLKYSFMGYGRRRRNHKLKTRQRQNVKWYYVKGEPNRVTCVAKGKDYNKKGNLSSRIRRLQNKLATV